nr:hypothetical protein [Desulfobulbaceae bacterium]
MTTLKNDQSKDTGLAITLIFLLICWITKNYNFVPAAIATLILTMTIPQVFTYPARFWFGLSHYMGEFVSKILLTIVFFILVIPMGFFRKLSGKDPMNLKKWRSGSDSVFITRDSKVTATDLEKPF